MAILGVARKFLDIVGAAGLLIDPPPNGPLEDFYFVEGYPAAINGQTIAPHPPCGSTGGAAHCAAIIADASDVVFINGIGVARYSDPATCLDIITSASNIVFAD
jgi:uncharacterized Zn-binding protein involved in type VI secretion